MLGPVIENLFPIPRGRDGCPLSLTQTDLTGVLSMKIRNVVPGRRNTAVAALILLGFTTATLQAQDRLRQMPGYDQYVRMSEELRDAVTLGTLRVTWADDSRSFEYT